VQFLVGIGTHDLLHEPEEVDRGVRFGQLVSDLGLAAPGVAASGSASLAPLPTKDAPNLNWAGLGVRVGVARWTLSARGLASNGHIGDLNATVQMLTPTLHLGGDRYFVKIDLPIGASDNLKLYGLGFYPVNYGYFIAPIHLFPYASLGLAFNYAVLHAEGPNPSRSGLLTEARAALGIKWRPIPFVCMSFEVGYSPLAAGFVGSVSPPMEGGPATITGMGGIGPAWDMSVGIELL
jgi:hypothetical protein